MNSSFLQHFRLRHHPFARAPSKDALCRHRGFAEASERLRFTIELESIGVLVAEPGCGKSLLLGVLTDELRTAGWVVHYFAHSSVGPFGLINVLARKVGQMPRRSRAETAQLVAAQLLEDQRSHLFVVDEAHELPDDTLEDIRLLTIADFDRKSPFVLVLAGQPTLDDRLAEPLHYALDQRITTIARLAPLSRDETHEYIRMRLDAAGAKKSPVFEDAAVSAVFEAAGGVPRSINSVATSAMIVAASRSRSVVVAQDVVDAKLDRGRG